MKKVLFAIAIVALALVSCAKFEPESEVTLEAAAVPTVSATVTGDTSIDIQVLPGYNTGYYAYAFVKGELDAAEVDAATLIAGKQPGAIATEVASAAKKDTLKKSITKLTPNTIYTLVAVAANEKTQTLSKVVSLMTVTSDSTVPSITLSSYKAAVDGDEMVFSVPFDDPIKITRDAAFIVQVFAKNYEGAAPYYILQPLATVPVPTDSVSVASDGKTLVVNVPKEVYVPGAYIALSIGPGSVRNELDQPNKAFTDNLIILRGNYTSYSGGLIGQFKNKNFELVNPIAADSVAKFQNPATLEVELVAKLAGDINGLWDYGEGGISVTAVNPVTGRKVEYPLEAWEIAATNDTTVVLGLDEAPDFGYYSNYSIDEGIVEDLYGNVNDALEIEDQVLCSFGYTDADVLGTYTFAGASYWGVDQNDPKVVIAPSDDEDYAFVVYDLFSNTHCLDDLADYGYTFVPDDFTKFYADFDFDSGILTVYGDHIGTVPGLGKPDVGAYGPGDDDEFTFAFTSSGNGVLMDNVYLYGGGVGTWDTLLPGGLLTRTATTYEYTEPAPAPARKKLAGPKDLSPVKKIRF